MAEDYLDTLTQWYSNMRPIYEGLINVVQNTLEVLIKRERIDYLSITSRAKSLDSFLEKIKRKPYKNPQEELTDFAGIRIITFIETDVPKICNLIRATFEVHLAKSLDKTEELGADRFGYRSVHYICKLGEDRSRLPEFSPYKELLFEIQVRTVLQHAWAEIEHDRNYKFSGVLPTHIQRRLHSLAGVLEMVDREFVVLANEVDSYAEEVSKETQLSNLEVNTTSLLEYLATKISRTNKGVSNLIGMDAIPEVVIDELRDFGVRTLSDLDKILNKDLLDLIVEYQPYTTYSGLLRVAMMYEDIDRYFAKAWKQNWKLTDYDSPDLLGEKYGMDKVSQILAENDVDIIRDAIRYEDRDMIDIIKETIRYRDIDQ